MSKRIIAPVKYPGGAFSLCNSRGDEFIPEIDKQPNVWALVKIGANEYFVTMPVTMTMLENEPERVEQSLIRLAENYPFN